MKNLDNIKIVAVGAIIIIALVFVFKLAAGG